MAGKPAAQLQLVAAAHPARGAAGVTDDIVEAITTAIVERRLMPGTKLVEQQIALMYQSSHSAEHSQDEHVGIVEALARRDARAAARLMERHIEAVERNLRLDPRTPDLASVLRPRN